jgi:hypothetical protein
MTASGVTTATVWFIGFIVLTESVGLDSTAFLAGAGVLCVAQIIGGFVRGVVRGLRDELGRAR